MPAAPALNPIQQAFLEEVLALKPRVAAFDCDGTLWDLDSGEGFFYWELDRGLIPGPTAAWARDRYEQYRRGEVAEEQMCGEMVAIHAGLREHAVRAAAIAFVEERIAALTFPEMAILVARLRAQQSQIWAVSSTNQWVVEEAARRLGIPCERVLAAAVVVKHGIVTDELVRVPSGPGKAVALRKHLDAPPDAAFGNSIHDLEMLELARRPFAVNPNPDLEKLALEKGWRIYKPVIGR